MTDNVLPFRKAIQGTIHGRALCLSCGHSWDAMADAGEISIWCPSCKLNKGAFFNCCTSDENHFWRCRCGCQVFGVDRRGIVCQHCGIRTGYADLCD